MIVNKYSLGEKWPIKARFLQAGKRIIKSKYLLLFGDLFLGRDDKGDHGCSISSGLLKISDQSFDLENLHILIKIWICHSEFFKIRFLRK